MIGPLCLLYLRLYYASYIGGGIKKVFLLYLKCSFYLSLLQHQVKLYIICG
jgi:hypothetical protein